MNTQQSQRESTITTKSARNILSYLLSFVKIGRHLRVDDDNSYSFASSSSSSVSTTSATSTLFSSSPSFLFTPSSPTLSTSTVCSSAKETIPCSSMEISDESAVLLQKMSEDKDSICSTWAFQDWLRQLPKIALFHLLSNTAIEHPLIAYQLLEYQYIHGSPNAHQSGPTQSDFAEHRYVPQQQCSDTLALGKEIQWVQSHARAIIHQLDCLRPNEQFARAKEINDRLLSLVRLCTYQFHGQWGDSWIALVALILVAEQCFDAPSEIRQYLFYRVKFGRILILEMANILKNIKVYRGKKASDHSNFDNNIVSSNLSHQQRQTSRPKKGSEFQDGCSEDQSRQSAITMTPQHHYLISILFVQRRIIRDMPVGIIALSGRTHSSDGENDSNSNNEMMLEWHSALKSICEKLLKFDEHWKHASEYQQVVTMASVFALR